MKELVTTELKLLYRRKQELVNPLLFFVLVCSLFPLAVSQRTFENGVKSPSR